MQLGLLGLVSRVCHPASSSDTTAAMKIKGDVFVAGGAFTGNKDIVLPAETVLSFKLLKPVEVKM